MINQKPEVGGDSRQQEENFRDIQQQSGGKSSPEMKLRERWK